MENKKCKFCGRKATRLCDIVIGKAIWAGHLPKVDGLVQYEEPMERNITCDNAICDKCTINLNEHMDICPDCFKTIKMKKPGMR